VDGDAIYIRDLTRIDAMDDEQVVQLTLLAATVIGSHTLALFGLDELVRRGLVASDLPRAYADALPDSLRNHNPKKAGLNAGKKKRTA